MSLATAKAAMKIHLQAMAANVDDEQATDAAIDGFLSAMQTWVSSGLITIPPGAIVVTGTAATQTNPAPVIVDNALS